jgi:hypothetical protein
VFQDYTDTPRWVEWQEIDGKKIPLIAGALGKQASVADPTTWPQALRLQRTDRLRI